MAQKILIFKIFFLIFLFNNTPLYPKTITGEAKVIDGDTIHINQFKIRLHGIDAPEKNQKCKYNNQDWLCGKQSTLELKKLINNENLKCNTLGIDRYKRQIAICYINQININKTMVKKGWAIAYRYYSLEFIADEDFARENKLGMWKGTFIDPYIFRKTENY